MHVPRRPRSRLLVLFVVVAALPAVAWFALRDSGLVAVQQVEVRGATGPQARAVRAALTTAGRELTTLHLRPAVLDAAVAGYPGVKDVTARADFPHALRIRVTQRRPVATLATARGAVPVAGDGTILRGTTARGVPELELRLPPVGDRITDRRTLAAVGLLASAPGPLRGQLQTAFRGPRGLTVRLDAGPSVHFGSTARTAAKWASLTAVLASPQSRGATTIDVRVPEHPAAAGLEQESLQRGLASTGT